MHCKLHISVRYRSFIRLLLSNFQHCFWLGNWDDDDSFIYNPPVNDKAISTLPAFSLGYINFTEENTTDQSHLSVQTLEVNAVNKLTVT